MTYFVKENSIVRQIWGKSDTILFIFAGAAAEFALNKAVDWLYFTGRLPKDPLGRLFSTVAYARKIVFSSLDEAHSAIDQVVHIHQQVESARGMQIPDWAYRDVLFMLIDYSIRAFELLERTLTTSEKAEVFDTFYRVGMRMGIKDLPVNIDLWELDRSAHLQQDLHFSALSADLFKQYRKNLGGFRYWIMLQVQAQLVPESVKELLSLGHGPFLAPMLSVYKASSKVQLQYFFKNLLLPAKFNTLINSLDSY